MKYIFLVVVFSISTLALSGQTKKAPPVLTTVSNKEVVVSAFKDATKIEKLNDYWYEILDSKTKRLGYAMTSLDYCKNIIGYSKNTPVMIITDKNFSILKVALLTHWETLSYVNKLERNGFFNLWNNKNLKNAQTVKLDAYTGATSTAKAVEKNLQFLFTNGLANMPTKK